MHLYLFLFRIPKSSHPYIIIIDRRDNSISELSLFTSLTYLKGGTIMMTGVILKTEETTVPLRPDSDERVRVNKVTVKRDKSDPYGEICTFVVPMGLTDAEILFLIMICNFIISSEPQLLKFRNKSGNMFENVFMNVFAQTLLNTMRLCQKNEEGPFHIFSNTMDEVLKHLVPDEETGENPVIIHSDRLYDMDQGVTKMYPAYRMRCMEIINASYIRK